MQSDSGKLFIGGISCDTNEERLREYFSSYGEIVEAVIMKNRTTGRARGFSFVVFADPTVADIVIKEGRTAPRSQVRQLISDRSIDNSFTY